MNDFPVRSFLTLCILLLSVFGQMVGHAFVGSYKHSTTEISITSGQSRSEEDQKDFTLIRGSTASGRVDIKFQAPEIVEEEEHEGSSTKRNKERSNYFDALLSALQRGHFFRSSREIACSADFLSERSFYRRHLLLQVFRI